MQNAWRITYVQRSTLMIPRTPSVCRCPSWSASRRSDRLPDWICRTYNTLASRYTAKSRGTLLPYRGSPWPTISKYVEHARWTFTYYVNNIASLKYHSSTFPDVDRTKNSVEQISYGYKSFAVFNYFHCIAFLLAFHFCSEGTDWKKMVFIKEMQGITHLLRLCIRLHSRLERNLE